MRDSRDKAMRADQPPPIPDLNRTAWGRIEFRAQLQPAPRTVEVPATLAAALAADQQAVEMLRAGKTRT